MRLFLILFIFFSISCIQGEHDQNISAQNQKEKKDYSQFLEDIISSRDSLNKVYSAADSSKKSSIITYAREYLISKMSQELFPYWYGTPWDFNGTTRQPQKGKIACGYFVTNILTDVGFKIPRIEWAQSASEVFIKKLAFGNMNRFSNKPISEIKTFLKKSGNGLYLVGLDQHTGFVFVQDDLIRFIHADYYEPEIGVVSEEIDSNSPIANSAYRVFGKLMSVEMMINWIRGIEMI